MPNHSIKGPRRLYLTTMEKIVAAWGPPLPGGYYRRWCTLTGCGCNTEMHLTWRDYKVDDGWYLSIHLGGHHTIMDSQFMGHIGLQGAMRKAEEILRDMKFSELDLPMERR